MENRVRVDGKLLKNILLDVSEYNFNYLFTRSGIPSRNKVLRNCGAVWKSPRLENLLQTFFWFFGVGGDQPGTYVKVGLFESLILCIPITLSHIVRSIRDSETFGREKELGHPFFLPRTRTLAELESDAQTVSVLELSLIRAD
jgi:hypothetical protein